MTFSGIFLRLADRIALVVRSDGGANCRSSVESPPSGRVESPEDSDQDD